MSFHRRAVGDDVHVPIFRTYADTAAREGDTTLLAEDDTKLALQSDNDTLWLLLDFAGPTWQLISGGIDSFTQLDDTPNTYTDDALKTVVVSSDETELIFDFDKIAKQVQTTGLLAGGVATQNAGNPTTQVDITAGSGCIVRYTDPAAPVYTEVSWPAQTVTPDLTIPGAQFIAFDTAGDFTQFPIGQFNNTARREFVLVGAFLVAPGAPNIIVFVGDIPDNLCYNGIASLQDFVRDVMGPANIFGNDYSPVSNDLTVQQTDGRIFILESNYRNDPEIPDELDTVGTSGGALTFSYVHRAPDPFPVVIFGADTTLIDPNNYDDGSGVLAAVPAGQFTIQRFFLFLTGGTSVGYGQVVYASEADARKGITEEVFEEKTPMPTTVFRAYMIVQQGTTDLSDTAAAEFFEATKFRIFGAAGYTGTSGLTTPGGPNESIQFNNATEFGGDAGFLWKGTGFELGGWPFEADNSDNLLIGTALPVLPEQIGSSNVVIGFGALGESGFDDVTGSENTVVGGDGLGDLNTGSSNLALGANAGDLLENGSSNIFIGADVLSPSPAVSDYMAIADVLFAHLTGGGIVRISGSGEVVQVGSEILQVDGESLFNERITGLTDLHLGDSGNVFINTTPPPLNGANNIAIGAASLSSANNINTVGNIAIGENALQNLINGNGNTALGEGAGGDMTAGSGNILLGINVLGYGPTTEDFMNLGEAIFAHLDISGATVRIAGDGNVVQTAFLEVLQVDGPGLFTDNVSIAGEVNTAEFFRDGNHYVWSDTEDIGGDSTIKIGTGAMAVITGTANRNVAIGLNALNALTTGNDNIAIGQGALADNIVNNANIAIGRDALADLSTGTRNIGIGLQAMSLAIVTGDSNIAMGVQALTDVTSGADNVLIGDIAGDAITTGDRNLGVGTNVLGSVTTGNGNIAMGDDALSTVTVDSLNTAIGDRAMNSATTANRSVAIGADAMRFGVTTGDFNIAVGSNALEEVTSGDRNVMVGFQAGQEITTGRINYGLGTASLGALTTGDANVAIGGNARALIDGDRNVFLGDSVANTLVGGDDNIIIGQGEVAPATPISDYINIGGIITGDRTDGRWRMGAGNLAPGATSALLELSGTTGALLLPRMDSTAEAALTAVNGMMIYNTTSNRIRAYTGGTWSSL